MHLFTYGTLMLPRVMEAVTGDLFTACRAVLSGYARFRIHGATYPGLIEQPGTKTEGMLYLNVDASSIARLDAFEGSLYDRVHAEVDTVTGGRVLAAMYVVKAGQRPRLSAEAWHLDAFERNHLDTFLAGYHGFQALAGNAKKSDLETPVRETLS